MMFRIRTKLLLYFMLLVALLSTISLFYYKNTENFIVEYDDSLKGFLLLNDISQKINLITDNLNSYISDKEGDYISGYLEEKDKLIQSQKQLYEEANGKDIHLINYNHMIDSFIEQADQTIAAFHQEDINEYSKHFSEVLKINGFIQETTLVLLNDKLTNYQTFYLQMEQKNHDYKLMSIFLFGATFLLSTLLALWVSGGITKPIKLLSKAAKEISKGNLSGEDIKITTKDELKPLTETFNLMRSNLNQLVLEIKQKSELNQLLKELELRSLQNQMNPHFLFNTLNVVSKMAYLEGAEQTKRLIESVATILRYNLSDFNHTSTLGEEVQIVKEYFFIQQTRFGERIQFISEIEEDALSAEVPCLILQPLIENAFIHGVESYEKNGKIHLYIARRNKQIIVEIIDNGVGMDDQTKQKLMSYMNERNSIDSIESNKEKSPVSTGIGVKNVIRRLQLFYQRNAQVEIESELNKGTTFRLFIPDFQKGK